MVQYKLYYFPLRGRAEVIRLVFAYAGVDYEDIRIPLTEWPQHKSSMPLEQMPVLEADGVKMPQSLAIVRYLARKYNLTGKTEMEAYWADVFIDTLDDIGKKYPSTKDVGERREEMKKEFIEVIAPKGFQNLERFYHERNNGKECFLVGEHVTFADLALVNYMDFMIRLKSDMFATIPGLQGVYNRVRALPKIKAWVEKRPETEY